MASSSFLTLRHAFRRLKRSPVFTGLTLATLAIGIGANTAIFSVLNGVLLKPLPYPDAGSLVGVWHSAAGLGIKDLNASPSSYFTYREENQTFQDIGLWKGFTVSVTGLAEPEQVQALGVTDGSLPVLGVQPLFGRWFSRQDDTPKSAETVMLSYGYWQRKFGGDRSVIGRTMTVDGRPREVIGVMPEGFRFLDRQPALILPWRFNRSELNVGNFSYQAVARLKPGVTITQANADLARMIPMVPDKFRMPAGLTLKMLEDAKIRPNIRPLMVDVVGDVGKVLWVLMATVGLVLFIACANVANLLLVRTEGRQQELAVRAALGASWSRIARDLLLETAALSLLGGALGVCLAYGAVRLLVYLAPANLPRLDAIAIDGMALAFALGVSVLSGLLFGLVPVFKYAGPRLNTALRAGGRNASAGRERHRTRGALVVVQVALALVLLTGSGLMLRTFQAMRHVEPGFRAPQEILTLRVSIPGGQIKKEERVAQTFHDMLDRIAAVPGVQSVAMSNSLTMDGNTNNDPVFVEDKPVAESKMPPIRRYKHISPGLFQTMGNPILAGRDFTWTDIHEMRPVVIISENLAKEYWGGAAAALGKRIRESPKSEWREIIGVAGDERDDGAHQKAPAIVYWTMLLKDFWGQGMTVQRSVVFAVRSGRAGSESFPKEIQKAVWSVNGNLPVANVRTMQETYNRSMARTSFLLVMLGIASAMAMLLGVVGIYGVISYSISQRTREIGIRMALGARQGQVRTMFVKHGLFLAAIGVACGAAAAIPLTRLMSALLFEVSPVDPLTYAGVACALVLAALAAAYIPARRATLIEPVEALRAE